MLLPLLAQLLVAAPLPETPGAVYHGRQQQVVVNAPFADAEPSIDGRVDEPQWGRAAVLTGFSLYQPLDGAPAPDSTEVLVLYTRSALYLAIRAFEPHGDPRTTVRATLADRDRISSDDNVQLLFDTFEDRRRAFVFSVNPLGVQADGIRSESGGGGGSVNLSSDFLYDSKGRLTDTGYEVELRIPFSSLRYPSGSAQRWGFNVVRTVQHSGYQQTWTPAKRASSSFLSQSGTLQGMTGLQRGRVASFNPEITARAIGDSVPGSARWHYRRAQDVGGNLKYDLSSSLTLNGTVHPDFSQVEADAPEIASDPRFALFYAEKRPFFIDGIEQFDVPNRLVYTRRVVQPIGAAKLTGTFAGTDVAVLAAQDARTASASGEVNPTFLVTRLRRDVAGGGTTLGLVFTDREEGANTNRVLGADAHILFRDLYYAQFQLAGSQTRRNGASTYAPLWEAVVDRTGRNYGFHYQLTGIAADFVASSGFISRTDYVRPSIVNRFTILGAPGAALENFTTRVQMNGTWRYRDFFQTKSMLENSASLENSFTFRGGWTVALSPTVGSYAFDPASFAGYAVAQGSDTTTFVVPGRLPAIGVSASLATPQLRYLSASVSFNTRSDVDFLEASRARRRDASASVDFRPTQQLRIGASYQSSALTRASDGVVVATARIPRVKTEYQVSRPVFVRLITQYDARVREPLLDYRTGAPIVIGTPGAYRPALQQRSNGVHVDGLFSYQPSPGTVVFLGYGNSLTEPDALAFNRLRRVGDGFFVKLSYLFQG
jgi:hypothetical protein